MKIQSVIAAVAVLLLAEGCDFLRSMAGRPTSDDLAALQESAPAAQAPSDTTTAVSEALPEDLIFRSPEESYLVVTGCYRDPRHAERSAARYRRQGYEACIVPWHGLQVVGLCPTGDHAEARRTLRHLRSKGVCPKGSWILENR